MTGRNPQPRRNPPDRMATPYASTQAPIKICQVCSRRYVSQACPGHAEEGLKIDPE